MLSLTFPSMTIASGKVFSAADSAFRNAESTYHIVRVPQISLFCRECIENVKLGDGQVIYVLQTSAVDSVVVVRKILVDPFEVDIAIDTNAPIVAVQIYVDLPIVGPLLLTQTMGALKFSSGIKIDFDGTPGDLASGVASVKMDATNNVVLSWDFTFLGEETKGSYIIVHI